MSQTWDVVVKETVRYCKTYKDVEAATYEEAMTAAHRRYVEDRKDVSGRGMGFDSIEHDVDARVVRQTSEPWVRVSDYIHWNGPHCVLVATRALGHVFTKSEIDLLLARASAAGLHVLNHWNGISPVTGEGLGTFSMQIPDDSPVPSTEVLAALAAPRSEP